MSASPLRPERADTPPFVKPYLQTLDRLQQREVLRPEQITAHARGLLETRFDLSPEPVEAAFAHGAVGLLGGHTHYFDGFAVLMPIYPGTAVAIRETRASRSKITFEGSDKQWTFDGKEGGEEKTEWPVWACIVERVVRALTTAGRQVEIAVVSTVQPGCMDAYLAALGVAAARAVQALFAVSMTTPELCDRVTQVIQTCTALPYSPAYVIAAEAGRPPDFILVDTATGEQIPIETVSRDDLGWGLVDIRSGLIHKPAQEQARKEKAGEALAALQKRGFTQLNSLRDIEHRDLQRVLSALPRRYKPIVRHLVAENRRVQKLVFAARRKDWQMFGALLLMSHASLREDWSGTNEKADFVVAQVEAMSLEGMYGACVTGRGGCVLLLGQPFVLVSCLDRIQQVFENRFGRAPETMLL